MGMTAAASPATPQLETLRRLVRTATQRLLGDTILVTDDQWRAPSRLPDWTRGHVATHDIAMPMPSADWLSGRAPGNARTCTPRPSIE